MRWLIFLSRVAFLSGLFMVLAFSLLFTTLHDEETVYSSIILAGYGLALVILPLLMLLYLAFSIINKQKLTAVPRWLLWCNTMFFIILLIFTFYINDPYYYQ